MSDLQELFVFYVCKFDYTLSAAIFAHQGCTEVYNFRTSEKLIF